MISLIDAVNSLTEQGAVMPGGGAVSGAGRAAGLGLYDARCSGSGLRLFLQRSTVTSD